jgi:hypothetical protein
MMDNDIDHDVVERVTKLVPAMRRNAAALDEGAIFPTDDVIALGKAGALSAPLPIAYL